MSDYISREAASADGCKHKIKTPFARIVVEGTPEKPCYNIWYFDPTDGECHIGFGSYCLDNVFNWLAEEFEITEPAADVEPVVRYKDCKHLRAWNQKDIYAFCPKTNIVFLPFEKDTRTFFCSFGEAKMNGGIENASKEM